MTTPRPDTDTDTAPCQHCGQPLGTSPPPDFCSENCQQTWHEHQAGLPPLASAAAPVAPTLGWLGQPPPAAAPRARPATRAHLTIADICTDLGISRTPWGQLIGAGLLNHTTARRHLTTAAGPPIDADCGCTPREVTPPRQRPQRYQPTPEGRQSPAPTQPPPSNRGSSHEH